MFVGLIFYLILATGPHETLVKLTKQVSTCLDLSNLGLRAKALAPLCKALNRQTNLLELDLSGNFLTTDCIQLFCGSLGSLQNLERLNLSCTGLLPEHIHSLADALISIEPKDLTTIKSSKLSWLDLSDNFLDDPSLILALSRITRQLKLKGLNLSSNQLIFSKRNVDLEEIELNLDLIQDLDLSGNQLTNDDVIKFVCLWSKRSRIKKLNCSRNLITRGFLRGLLDGDGIEVLREIEILNLSRCQIEDSELFDLLR